MIGSNSGRFGFLTVALLVAVGVVPAAAVAQTPRTPGAPLLLTPPMPEPPADAAPADGAQPDAASAPAQTSPNGIQVAPLAPPTADASGLLDVRSGGFPDTLWQGATVETARALVSQLPRRYGTFAARRLAERFLLSAAPAPAEPQGSQDGGTLLAARMSALAGMGDWADALALADLVGAEQRSPAMRQAHTDGLLVENKMDAACNDAQRGVRDFPDEPYWQKVQVLCQLVRGENAAAGLAIGVMHEQGIDDRAFFWAADVAQGTPMGPVPPVDATEAMSPVVLALLRQSGKPMPAKLLEGDDPTVLKVAAQIAASDKTTGDINDALRIATVEHALSAGVAEPETLRALYAAAKQGVDPAENTRVTFDTAPQRAAAYQLAVAQSVPNARAEIIARAFEDARQAHGRPEIRPITVALVYAPMVMEMQPTTDLAWFAGTAARILIGANAAGLTQAKSAGPDMNTALHGWFDLLAGMGTATDDIRAVETRLWPYRQLAAGGTIDHEAFEVWRAAVGSRAPADMQRDTTSLLGLLTAVGDGVVGADWQAVFANGAIAPTSVAPVPLATWRALTPAVRDRHLGEGVALALALLGPAPADADDIASDKAIESLVLLGRSGDARAIAAELALARGL
jgi:hypothetical protein